MRDIAAAPELRELSSRETVFGEPNTVWPRRNFHPGGRHITPVDVPLLFECPFKCEFLLLRCRLVEVVYSIFDSSWKEASKSGLVLLAPPLLPNHVLFDLFCEVHPVLEALFEVVVSHLILRIVTLQRLVLTLETHGARGVKPEAFRRRWSGSRGEGV